MNTAKRLGRAAVLIGVVGFALSWLATLVPVWPFALVEHFRLQLVCGGIALTAVVAIVRMRVVFDVALVTLLMHAIFVVPDLTSARREVPPGDRIRVLLLNVHTSSSAFDDVRKLITDVDADVLGLVETDQRWLTALAPTLAAYQRIEHPQDDNFGLALYSKLPLRGRVEVLQDYLPSLFADVDTPSGPLHIILTHPIPPVSAQALRDQIAVFDVLASRAGDERTIVMGDFNATPWSRPFQRFASATGLCDTRAGFGVQASFPAASAVLRIPIDHVLVSCDLGVTHRRIERDVGSDHLPVVVDLVVP